MSTPVLRIKVGVWTVDRILVDGEPPYERVELRVVDSVDPYEIWSETTPNASLDMVVTHAVPFGTFVEGQEYYLDLIPVGASEGS